MDFEEYDESDETRINQPYTEEDEPSEDDYQSAPPTPRKSRARDRIERRRQGSDAKNRMNASVGVVAPPTPRRTQQVRKKRELKIGNLPIQQIQLFAYGAGALVLVIGVIIVLNLFKDEEVLAAPNAIWIGTEWTYDARSDEDIQVFADLLREHQVGTVYAWVGWLNASNEWAGSRDGAMPFSEREASVRTFVTQFKAAYPEVRLYGWIGVPVSAANIPYRLNDTAVHDTVALFSASVVNDLGFDGVFLNAEPIWNDNDEDFLRFLSRVRLELGNSAPISVAIPPDWTPLGVNIPQPSTVTPGTEWDRQFKQRVALLTDEMAIMAYNSGLTNPFDYIQWMAYQVEAYAEAIGELDTGAQIVIGIPTYDNELPGHDTQVENVLSSISGIQQGLEAAGESARVVTGVAIYAGWTTDETEWQQFYESWVGQ